MSYKTASILLIFLLALLPGPVHWVTDLLHWILHHSKKALWVFLSTAVGIKYKNYWYNIDQNKKGKKKNKKWRSIFVAHGMSRHRYTVGFKMKLVNWSFNHCTQWIIHASHRHGSQTPHHTLQLPITQVLLTCSQLSFLGLDTVPLLPYDTLNKGKDAIVSFNTKSLCFRFHMTGGLLNR